MKSKYCLYILLIFTIISCRSIKDSSLTQSITISKCNQQSEYLYTADDLPIPLNEKLKSNATIRNNISPNSLYIANIINILDELEKLNQLNSIPKEKLSINDRLKIVELKQKIDNKINNSSLIISAVSAELDCEEERINQVANYMSEKQSNLESKLTIGAIVIGATGALLTGAIIKNPTANDVVGISTGIAEAALGFTMLFNKRKIKIEHEKNTLKDIWEGPTVSKIFPPFIWYYLNNEDENNNSLRKEIIAKWMQFGQIDETPSNMTDLYFGNGGVYTTDQLNNRADMYDQLGSEIYLLKQRLMTLAIEIDAM